MYKRVSFCILKEKLYAKIYHSKIETQFNIKKKKLFVSICKVFFIFVDKIKESSKFVNKIN